MDKTGREGLEKAYGKEKGSRALRNAVITHYRTVRFKSDMFKFAHGKAAALCMN